MRYANPRTMTKQASCRAVIVAFGSTSIHCPVCIGANTGVFVGAIVGTFTGDDLGIGACTGGFVGVFVGGRTGGEIGVDVSLVGVRTGVGTRTGASIGEVTGNLVGDDDGTCDGAFVGGLLLPPPPPNTNAQRVKMIFHNLENNMFISIYVSDGRNNRRLYVCSPRWDVTVRSAVVCLWFVTIVVRGRFGP